MTSWNQPTIREFVNCSVGDVVFALLPATGGGMLLTGERRVGGVSTVILLTHGGRRVSKSLEGQPDDP